jgi:hypothetical protein
MPFDWLKRLFGGEKEASESHGEEYRQTDPREVVTEGGTAMSGPGGAPQEDLSIEERRDLDRETD